MKNSSERRRRRRQSVDRSVAESKFKRFEKLAQLIHLQRQVLEQTFFFFIFTSFFIKTENTQNFIYLRVSRFEAPQHERQVRPKAYIDVRLHTQIGT